MRYPTMYADEEKNKEGRSFNCVQVSSPPLPSPACQHHPHPSPPPFPSSLSVVTRTRWSSSQSSSPSSYWVDSRCVARAGLAEGESCVRFAWPHVLPPLSCAASDCGGQFGRTLCDRQCFVLPGILHRRPQETDEGRVSGMEEWK